MAHLRKVIERLPLAIKPANLKIGRELNRGAYGVVHEGVFAGQKVAVKAIHKLLLEADGGENPLHGFCEECERLEELDHPHVIKFLGAFKDAKLGPILVMEKMKENLRQFLDNHTGRLTIQEQIRISLEITQGIAFLHQQNPPMIHRDLNDKNVMFTFDGVAKIGDFGQSKLKQQVYLTTALPGMVSYMPPEAFTVEEAKYDESLDIFSLGVLMLEIGTQQPPIVNVVGIGIVTEIKRREKDLQQMSDVHPLKPFILLCLSDDKKQRPKASELEMVLPRLDVTILQTMIAAEERFCKLKTKCDGLEQQCASLQQEIEESKKMQEIERKEELSAAKIKMDRMMNDLKEEYRTNLQKKDDMIHALKSKKKNVSKMDQVMKSPMDIAAAGIIMTKDDVIQMLKDQIESLRHEVEAFEQLLSEKCYIVRALKMESFQLRETYGVPDQFSSLQVKSEDIAAGKGEYIYASDEWPLATTRAPSYTSSDTAVTGQQHQLYHHDFQPCLLEAEKEEHEYINVASTAHAEAVPSKQEMGPSERSQRGLVKQHSNNPERASPKLKLKPSKSDTEELVSGSIGLGAKKVCRCGRKFTDDEGIQFVRHALTCSMGTPVRPPSAGRH